MSQEEQEKRSGCSRPVVTFFIIAVAIVAAFLIIGLVRTCDTDHENNVEQIEVVDQNAQP